MILTPRLKLSEELYFITTVAQSRPTHTIISKHCTREFIWNGKRLQHGLTLVTQGHALSAIKAGFYDNTFIVYSLVLGQPFKQYI